MAVDPAVSLILDGLALGLALTWLMGRLAHRHWFLELFSHFTVQFALAGLVLSAVSLIIGAWMPLVLSVTVVIHALLVIGRLRARHHLADAAPAEGPTEGPAFTIALHNRLFTLRNHAPLAVWLTENADHFDAALIIETTDGHWQATQSVIDLYPHQYRMDRKRGHGLILVSRHPFLEIGESPLPDLGTPNQSLRALIAHPALGAISIHCVHPPAPLTPAMARQRNSDLRWTAQRVAADPADRRIMMGDWNLTPFSPLFGDVIRVSGLRYHYPGFLPLASWPSFGGFDPLRIPLDHILHGGDWRLVSLTTGPAMGSDHHPVIARLAPLPDPATAPGA